MGKALIIKNADFSVNAVAHIDIEENIPCTGLALSLDSQSVEYVGDTLTITATKTPADATDVITWSSSNERIATVDNNGIVTVYGIGEAVITAVCGEATATISINQQGSIKLGNLVNISGYYADKVPTNNAANLVYSATWRTIGNPYDGNENYNIVGGEREGIQIMPIPYGARYAFLHFANESVSASGRYVYYDVENLTEYNGAYYATYLGSTSTYGLGYRRLIENTDATGIAIRHTGSEGNSFDYITFSA